MPFCFMPMARHPGECLPTSSVALVDRAVEVVFGCDVAVFIGIRTARPVACYVPCPGLSRRADGAELL